MFVEQSMLEQSTYIWNKVLEQSVHIRSKYVCKVEQITLVF
jgi:hypothetical protein